MTGFDSLRPCECGELIYTNGLSSSRPKRTLTIEEIASNGIEGRDLATARPVHRSPSAGRRRGTAPGRNPGALAWQVRLLPRGLTGPTHKWRCTSPARRTKTVRVRLGPLGQPSDCPLAAVAESGPSCGRGGIGRRTGLRSRRSRSMRVRASPSVLWRETRPIADDPCSSEPTPPSARFRRPAFCAVARSSGPGFSPPCVSAATGNRAGSYPADRSSTLRGRTIREWCNRQHTWL